MDDSDAKRIVDFAAGLIFGLRGSIERVTNKVFLLSPANVDVGAEARRADRAGRVLQPELSHGSHRQSVSPPLIWLFLLLLIARLIISLIMVFARDLQPTGVVVIIFESVMTVTDPPLKALRRFIPPLRIGQISPGPGVPGAVHRAADPAARAGRPGLTDRRCPTATPRGGALWR